MSRHGQRLTADETGLMVCPESGYCHREVAPSGGRCLDLDEDAPLPPGPAVGRQWQDELRRRKPLP